MDAKWTYDGAADKLAGAIETCLNEGFSTECRQLSAVSS